LAINKTWLAAHPDAVKNLILAWDDAMKYYASNHDDAVAIMAKGVGAKPSDLTATLAGVKLYTVQDNKDMMASGEMAKNFAGISTTLQLMGNVKAPVTLDQAGAFNYFP
jgi:NitT/TauT family transport system substrate-binding protein